VIVETARLVGEPISPAHHEALCVLLGDPRVGATLGGTATPEQVADEIATLSADWDRQGFGYWSWREKATGDLVARGGLHRTLVDGRAEVEVGWAVMADRWGEGFATEVGAACVRVAFDRLGLEDIVAFTLPDNRASRRVMEKLGFAYEKDIMHANLPHVLYRLYAGAARPGTAMPAS
jgi:[ribosomal protein S5]-alanine N-acetyltransferase